MIKVLDLNFLGHKQTIAAFLVETSIGPILFETGPHSSWSNLGIALAEHGYKYSDIRHVLITHIHLDHAGAAWAMAEHGAYIYMHPLGTAHMIDPSKLLASATKIYGDKMDYLWGQLKPIPANKVKAIADGAILRFGDTEIIAHHTPGHAIHHIAWQIGDEIITGDVAGVCINNGPAVPPCPPPDINIEDWITSIHKLKSLNPKGLFLTHFGRVDAPESHFEYLEERLIRWSNFIKEKHNEGIELQALIALFKNKMLDELKGHAIEGEDQKRYDAANPADMSVTGILRYWKKKGELVR
ncbi:MBL fold metallo-hydrolase [Fulvivirgaceae bacterium LMO-SS25]